MNEWYSVNCITINTSSGPEKAFLNHTKLNLGLLNVSIELQTVTINSPIAIASYDQRRGARNNSVQKSIDLAGSPFLFSRIDNLFVVLGCGHANLMEGEKIWAVVHQLVASETTVLFKVVTASAVAKLQFRL